MAYKYKYLDGNVSYSEISDVGVIMGSKVGFAEYLTSSDHTQITMCRPVVNAIDIDWNGATIEGMSWEINTTGDLLRALKSLHTMLTSLKIPHSILELEGGSRVLTIDNFETIKEELRGLSAYEIAKKLAEQNSQYFPYTEETWIASLKGATGAPGANGTNGKSAYELALARNPNIGSEEQWLASLKGKSAFETAMQAYNTLGYPFPYQNEVEWMDAIAKVGQIDGDLNELLASKQDVLYPGDGISISGNVISTPVVSWINIIS